MKIRKSFEVLPEREIHKVIYGPPGIGKTSLSFTMPAPVLHIDSNSGIDRAEVHPGELRPDSIALTNEYPFEDFYKDVTGSGPESLEQAVKTYGYKSISIDTIGSLLENHIAPYLMRIDPKNATSQGLSLTGWGAMSRVFNLLLARFRNLGLDVLSVCHSKGNKEDGYALDVKGSSRAIIEESSDQIGFMYYHGEKLLIDYRKGAGFTAKDTGEIISVEVPHYERPEYKDLAAQICRRVKDKLIKRSEGQIKVLEQIEAYKEDIAKGSKPADFDAIISMLAEEPNKAIAMQLKPIVGQRLKQLSFKYDPEAGKVIGPPQQEQTVKEEEAIKEAKAETENTEA